MVLEKKIILHLDSVVRFENESLECSIKRRARDIFRKIYSEGNIDAVGITQIDDIRKEITVLIQWSPK